MTITQLHKAVLVGLALGVTPEALMNAYEIEAYQWCEIIQDLRTAYKIEPYQTDYALIAQAFLCDDLTVKEGHISWR